MEKLGPTKVENSTNMLETKFKNPKQKILPSERKIKIQCFLSLAFFEELLINPLGREITVTESSYKQNLQEAPNHVYNKISKRNIQIPLASC